jgi:hypothetical protein
VLSQPKIPHRSVVSVLRRYGLKIAEATFLPSGDANSVVYRVMAGESHVQLRGVFLFSLLDLCTSVPEQSSEFIGLERVEADIT